MPSHSRDDYHGDSKTPANANPSSLLSGVDDVLESAARNR